MQESLPHIGILDFISKEDLICKVGVLKHTIHTSINKNSVMPSDYKVLGKFRRYIENKVSQIRQTALLPRKR